MGHLGARPARASTCIPAVHIQSNLSQTWETAFDT